MKRSFGNSNHNRHFRFLCLVLSVILSLRPGTVFAGGGGSVSDKKPHLPKLQKEWVCPQYKTTYHADMYVPVGNSHRYGIATNGNPMNFEGCFGDEIICNGTDVTYQAYANSSTPAEPVATKLDNDEVITTSSKSKVNTVRLTDGMHTIATIWNTSGKNMHSVAYILVENGHATCCINASKNLWESFQKLLADTDPKSCTSLKGLTYPTAGFPGNCNHVQLFVKEAEKLLEGRNVSDQYKVYMFAQWLSETYAYDDWRIKQKGQHSRAFLKDNYNDDNLFMYYNKVGVCWDFTNALVIMCRSQGIPATSVENNGHTAAAIYLPNNGGWIEVDITDFNKFYSDREIPDKSKWTEKKQCLLNFGCPKGGWLTVGHQVWTQKTATE